jgi:hypothetical protein
MTLPWIIAMTVGVLVVVTALTYVLLDGELFLAVIAGVLAGAFAFVIPMAINSANDYEQWCRAQGGHTDTHSESTVVTTVNGSG